MHFGGLEDCRKDYTSPHITSGPQLGGHRHWGLAICTFHLGFSLVLTDMEPDAEIEALAAARSVAVHWGSTDNLVEHLVELAAERKVYVRPTSAGIAAEAELVLPGSTRAVRTPEPLAAPAHQVHIHVEHLHIHVAGPEGLTDLQEAPH